MTPPEAVPGRAPAPAPASVTLAVGGILERDGKILLVKRGHPPGLGRWSLPGGRVEDAESLDEALRREMLEETALQVEVGELVGVAERSGPGYHFVILDFRVDLSNEEQVPTAGDDAAEVAFVARESLAGLELVSGLLDFLVEHGFAPRCRD